MHLRPVYKPHSVHGAWWLSRERCFSARIEAWRHWAIISLGDASPRRSVRPTRDWLSHRMREHVKKTSSLPPSADGFVPTWSCSRRGLPGHPHYCRCRWSFTPPFHHHPPRPLRGKGGCLFLWPSSGRLAPHGGFPAPGAIRRRALWSADFPRPRKHRTAIAQPT